CRLAPRRGARVHSERGHFLDMDLTQKRTKSSSDDMPQRGFPKLFMHAFCGSPTSGQIITQRHDHFPD
ncbi:hypothetical protein, partial [Roseovarius sp.]|uniref:hypothetical protein n=1 Tax=Roseovarius sp. TaxID=1486281 RepID=UPI0035662795